MQVDQPQRVITALQAFLTTSLDDLLKQHTEADPETAVLTVFQHVAATVPAYQMFLKQHEIDPAAIQTFADFQRLPLSTKANYIQRYTLAQLCPQGHLETSDMIAVSSGSTGHPTFWPRCVADEFQIAFRFEQIFRDSFQANRHRTLAVVCFALGTWVGGMYTANCCRHLASKGYPIMVVTPGNHKPEIFRVIQSLSPAFEQVVLLGYPPFLKDVIDSGIAQGVSWPQYNLKLVMAGEVFSEEWRALVGERVGSTQVCYDSASLYGTADAGVLGNETPLSICIRRWLAEHPDTARELFGESRLPTLVQYDPMSRFFEVQGDGTLVFSGDNGVPLVRYHISDNGGLIPYATMLQTLQDYGFDPVRALSTMSLPQNHHAIHPLPFVYIFGRSHFVVSYFGANLYPENVSVGLEQISIRDWVTGKFVMQVKDDADQNPFLSIVVELAPGVEGSEEKQQEIANSIQRQLQRLNSEFANYVPARYQMPKVTLTATGDPDYFPLGVKHYYTRAE